MFVSLHSQLCELNQDFRFMIRKQFKYHHSSFILVFNLVFFSFTFYTYGIKMVYRAQHTTSRNLVLLRFFNFCYCMCPYRVNIYNNKIYLINNHIEMKTSIFFIVCFISRIVLRDQVPRDKRKSSILKGFPKEEKLEV